MSFGVAAAFGVVQFSGLPPGFGRGVLRIALTTIIFAVVFLGEEIGWRGYLLFRVAELTSGRRAALVTGFFHAIYHLPLLLIATTYQSAGNRWIVVPMVMVTLTLAGVWYGWLRLWSGSIWPVSLSHSAFNNLMETAAGVTITTSPATMAYVTTETGVVTMIIMVLVAGYLLTRGPQTSPKPSRSPRGQPLISAPLHDGHVRTSHARPTARLDLHAEITPGNLEHSCATLRLSSSAGGWCGLGAYNLEPGAGLLGAAGLAGPDVAAGSPVHSPGAVHRNLWSPAVDHLEVRPQNVPERPTLRR